jgi:hypothetical protein
MEENVLCLIYIMFFRDIDLNYVRTRKKVRRFLGRDTKSRYLEVGMLPIHVPYMVCNGFINADICNVIKGCSI